MEIIKYELELDGKHRPYLMREAGFEYAENKFCSPLAAVNMLNTLFHLNKKAEEHLFVLGMDAKSRILGVFEVSKGTATATVCSAREIFIRLLLCGSVSMIAAHNHPSGDITPSKEDMATFRKIKDAANLLGIQMSDNIIIGDDNYLSFYEQGYMA